MACKITLMALSLLGAAGWLRVGLRRGCGRALVAYSVGVVERPAKRIRVCPSEILVDLSIVVVHNSYINNQTE